MLFITTLHKSSLGWQAFTRTKLTLSPALPHMGPSLILLKACGGGLWTLFYPYIIFKWLGQKRLHKVYKSSHTSLHFTYWN